MEGDLQQTLGANLRAFREVRGFTQEGFAEEIGIHRTYWGDIERGKRNLTLRKLERLAAQLKADPITLLIEGDK